MQKHIRAYLSRIGKKGGQAKSQAKITAARKNGALGGRPKQYEEATAYQALEDVKKGEDWQIVYMDFVDGFRRSPSLKWLKEPPRRDHASPKLYALLQSICIKLCLENDLPIRGWLTERAFLREPWFVSGMKSLYATALRESPVPFRKNNIFVMGNFLDRV